MTYSLHEHAITALADPTRRTIFERVARRPQAVGELDPVARLAMISQAMAGIKESGQAVGAQVLTQLSGFAPPTIMAQAARLQARQRLFNLVVTNVPGPQFPPYVLGRRLEALYPMVPLSENTAVGIAIMSYHGQLSFGLTADYDALGDVDSMAGALSSAIAELGAAAEGAPSYRRQRGSRAADDRTASTLG